MSLRIGRQRWKAGEETKILTRQQVAPREGNQVEGAHPKRGGGTTDKFTELETVCFALVYLKGAL